MRNLNKAEVQKILDSFADLGCNRFDRQHLIPLVVKKQYIKEATYHTEFPDNEGLRILELKTDVPSSYQVAAASSQHRVDALRRWVAQQTAKVKAMQKEVKKVKAMPEDAIGEDDVALFNQKLKPQLDTMTSILANGGCWGIAIYDAGV